MADFTMFSGDTKVIHVTAVESDNTPLDLTDVDIAWILAKKVTAPVILNKTIGAGITVTDAVNGVFEITMDPLDTAALKGTYYQEVQIDDAGAISTIMTGTVTINPDAIQ
jgi:hypothetical protein